MCRGRNSRVLHGHRLVHRGARLLWLAWVLMTMGVCEQALAQDTQAAMQWCTQHSSLLASAELVAAARLCLRPVPSQGTEELVETGAAGGCQACQCRLMASMLPATLAYFSTRSHSNSSAVAAASGLNISHAEDPGPSWAPSSIFHPGPTAPSHVNSTYTELAPQSSWLLSACLPVVLQLWSTLPLTGIDIQPRLRELAACSWDMSLPQWQASCPIPAARGSSSSTATAAGHGQMPAKSSVVSRDAAETAPMTIELDVVEWRAMCACEDAPGEAMLCDPDSWHTYPSTCHAKCMGIQDVSRLQLCNSLFRLEGIASPQTHNHHAASSLAHNETVSPGPEKDTMGPDDNRSNHTSGMLGSKQQMLQSAGGLLAAASGGNSKAAAAGVKVSLSLPAPAAAEAEAETGTGGAVQAETSASMDTATLDLADTYLSYYYDEESPGSTATMSSVINSKLELSSTAAMHSDNSTLTGTQHARAPAAPVSSIAEQPGASIGNRTAQPTSQADDADSHSLPPAGTVQSVCPLTAEDVYLALDGPALPSYLTSCGSAACMFARLAAAAASAASNTSHTTPSVPDATVNMSNAKSRGRLGPLPPLWNILLHPRTRNFSQQVQTSLLHNSSITAASTRSSASMTITACLPELVAAVLVATGASGPRYIAALQACDISSMTVPDSCLVNMQHQDGGSLPTFNPVTTGTGKGHSDPIFQAAQSLRNTLQASPTSQLHLPDLQLPLPRSPSSTADVSAVPAAAQVTAALPLMASTPQLAQLLEKVSVLLSPDTAGLHTSSNNSKDTNHGTGNRTSANSMLSNNGSTSQREGAGMQTRHNVGEQAPGSTLQLSQFQTGSQQAAPAPAESMHSDGTAELNNTSDISSGVDSITPSEGVWLSNSSGSAAPDVSMDTNMMQANVPSSSPVWSYTGPTGNFHISITQPTGFGDTQDQVSQQPTGLIATLLQGRTPSGSQLAVTDSTGGGGREGEGQGEGEGGGWPQVRWPALCTCGRDYQPVCSKVTQAWYPSTCYAKCQGVDASELVSCADVAVLTAATTASSSDSNNKEGVTQQMHPGAHDTQQDDADSSDSSYYYY